MSERTTPGFAAAMVHAPPVAAVAIGLVFVWFSLGPSLLPRNPMMQGVASSLSFAFGYALGVLLDVIVRAIYRQLDRPMPAVPKLAWLVLGLGAIGLAASLVLLWPQWQSEQREMVGLDSIGVVDGVMALVWTLVIAIALLGLARILRWLLLLLDGVLGRHMPRMAAHALVGGLVIVVVAALYAFIASSGLAQFANARFAPGDETTLEGVEQPTSPTASGSAESLVRWEDLGYQGRTFAGTATSVEDLNAFNESADSVLEPIRVYAGLQSADDAAARAQLVVDELVRTGAADREVLVVVATTGTGWVDPVAAASIEYMYNGDTAIAAMQYSFLPSWISFILDTATSTEAGTAINEAVIEWWLTLPENDRPKLYAFGESLGSLGSEAAFARETLDGSLAYAQSVTDGVVWIGPTEANLVRTQLVADRSPSPVWVPVYDNGRVVRTANLPGDALENLDSWQEPRVLYFHHPSDPVGYWSWDTLWKPQEWTDDPVGYDVPDSVRWVPFTTFVQVVADLIAGFSAEAGHGHNYNIHFVEAWTAVAPPDGWSLGDADRLEAYLESIAPLPGM